VIEVKVGAQASEPDRVAGIRSAPTRARDSVVAEHAAASLASPCVSNRIEALFSKIGSTLSLLFHGSNAKSLVDLTSPPCTSCGTDGGHAAARLMSEGATFSSVPGGLRFDLAERYIADHDPGHSG
jgi:hypothetical protein